MSSYLGLPSYHPTKAQNIQKILNKTLFLRQLVSPHDDPLFYKKQATNPTCSTIDTFLLGFQILTTAFPVSESNVLW